MSQDEARAEARRVVEQAAEESTSALLGEIAALLRRFVVMSAPQARVVALWAVHTHLIASCEATPYLAVTSPEKRSGKTRLLEVLELVVARPWLTGRTTAAVLPRKIDADHPTLLLDESDAAFGGDKEYAEALRGVLNTGHRRGGRATVCVGQGATIGFKDFSTFCPKAIAGIGKLPDTVADRAIPIRLARRAPGEQVDRFRRREVEPQTQQLRKRLAALTDVVAGTLADAHPDLPAELDDRAWDGVEPLLAIADLAGGGWPITSRAACVELYGGREIDDESSGVRLLADVRDVFEDRDTDRLATAGLLDGLHRVDEAPWGDWYGKPLSARSLAKMLRPYGVHSRTVRLDDGTTPKGYLREQFDEPWGRYTPSTPPPKRHNATTRSQSGIEPDFKTPQGPFVADSESTANPHHERVVADVADREAEQAGFGVQEPLSAATPEEEAEAERLREKFANDDDPRRS
jgi:Protein of unknown function (DUF3631)